MSNILILHSGLNGMTNACLELARRLEDARFNVHTASMKDNDEKLQRNGLKRVEVNPIQFDYASLPEEINLQGSKHNRFQAIYDNLNFQAFSDTCSSLEIDLVLVDMELHEYILYMNEVGIPFALLSQWFTIWPSERTPPLSSNQIPSPSSDHKNAWKINRLTGRAKTLAHAAKTNGFNRKVFILFLANKWNFDQKEFQRFLFPLPFGYKSFPVISMTHPDLEFDQKTRKDLFYAYPMVANGRKEEVSDQFNIDFERIVVEKKRTNKKLIVVTQTTMGNGSARALSSILNLLSSLDDCISIVSLGSQYDEQTKDATLKNVYVYRSIPQLKALEEADLSINHGGIHTINECIHFKTPMLVVSGNKYDQNGCAARIQCYGCGISIEPKRVTVENLHSAIQELLSNNKYLEKMEALHDAYRRAKHANQLEHHIKKLIARKRD